MSKSVSGKIFCLKLMKMKLRREIEIERPRVARWYIFKPK
jgi:hypothetical protein